MGVLPATICHRWEMAVVMLGWGCWRSPLYVGQMDAVALWDVVFFKVSESELQDGLTQQEGLMELTSKEAHRAIRIHLSQAS